MNKRPLILSLGIFLLILSIAFTISSYTKMPYEKDIYGVWRGVFNGKEMIFIFENDRTCVLNFKDNTAGFVETLNGDFEIDFSKSPFPLTIRNIKQFNNPLYTIVEFIGDESIRIAPFQAHWKLRPISFEPDKNPTFKKIGGIQ